MRGLSDLAEILLSDSIMSGKKRKPEQIFVNSFDSLYSNFTMKGQNFPDLINSGTRQCYRSEPVFVSSDFFFHL